MRSKKRNHLLLDILILVLTVALVLAFIFAVSSFRDALSLGYDADSFYYRLSDGDYGAMVEMYYENESLGIRPDEELQPYYAIARFFEAACWYRAYEGREEAEGYLSRMREAEADMGELRFVADEIRAALSVA